MAVIWLAFFIEFVVKIAIAESRIEYVRRNWLDLIVLCIPLLRPLRVASLARTSRVFTLRGVGMKFLQYIFTFIIGLEATDRLLDRVGLGNRRDRNNPLQMTRYELINELKRRRKTCDAWDAWYEREREHLERCGVDMNRLADPPQSGHS